MGSSADAVYEVKVNAPVNVEIDVKPTKLVFSTEKQSLSYEITFKSILLDGSSDNSFGSIEWSDGVNLVKSPIAIRWHQGSRDSI